MEVKGVYSQRGNRERGKEVSSHGDADQKPKGPQDLGKTCSHCFLSSYPCSFFAKRYAFHSSYVGKWMCDPKRWFTHHCLITGSSSVICCQLPPHWQYCIFLPLSDVTACYSAAGGIWHQRDKSFSLTLTGIDCLLQITFFLDNIFIRNYFKPWQTCKEPFVTVSCYTVSTQ